MPLKALWIKHRTDWGTSNSHGSFGSQNPRSWSRTWGHLSNTSEITKKRLSALKTEVQSGLLKMMLRQLTATTAQHTSFHDALLLPSSQIKTTQPRKPRAHGHAGVCRRSLAASFPLPIDTCRTGSSKATLPALCRAWTRLNYTSLQNLLLAGQFSSHLRQLWLTPPPVFFDRNTCSIHTLLADF